VDVSGCFIRTLDDLVVVKTDKGQGETRHVTVHDCVLWNELAHALSVGAELRENVDDVCFRDCDIIHDKGREWTLRVYHCDSARIRHIRFENLRIEETHKFMSLWIGSAVWTRDTERGHIEDITFKNIQATGDKPHIEFKGFDPAHGINHVVCDHVVINGQPLELGDIQRNAAVQNVTVTP
jgi:polygalacturonase